MVRYEHTQTGTVILAVAGGVSLFVLVLMMQAGFWPGPFVLLGMGVLAALFYALTVEVDQEKLSLRFGIGLIRKTIPLQSIQSVRPVRHRWFYGYGIRFTPYGWIWIVSGLSAVQLDLSNGKRFNVGTDEPRELIRALSTVEGITVEG